jgi:hypothetical protein
MFHDFDTPCDRIVCLLADKKCDFGAIEKEMFQVVEWHLELNICIWLSQNATFFCRLSDVYGASIGNPNSSSAFGALKNAT